MSALRIQLSEHPEVIWEQQYAGDPERIVEESELQIRHPSLQVQAIHTRFRGVHIVSGEVLFPHPVHLRAHTTPAMYELTFFSEHDICYFYRSYTVRPIQIDRYQAGYSIVTILLSESFMRQVIAPFTGTMGEWLTAQGATLRQVYSMPLTPSMKIILYKIRTCRDSGLLKRMLLESKVLDLLVLLLKQITPERQFRGLTVRLDDVDKLYEVKRLVEQHITHQHSLRELARQVGLNEFKLKKGFRELFGTTIFSYLLDLRMEHARQLLLQGTMTVKEVAEEVGYRYTKNFLAAFKKKFKILPGAVGPGSDKPPSGRFGKRGTAS
ncbi:helix-turn-helix transcriptional regulator [Dawidia soli]|uniref:AraC family transcriptional regulator n=1 Tax=Dawidia soli TaxID=2782352 RepID=A0AAP2GKK1_9BACT|nr:AraC family transcriptional regulator [Dawidia soli]MBT1689705.1 AraC family transcriptional regulator [Dawidia soli]